MVWCIFWVWNVAMKKMYEKELWNLLRTNAPLFYFDAPSTKIITPLGGKSKWTPEFTPLNKLLYMKKTLALQSINNELNSELSYQYKDSNRINTLICTLFKIFSSKTYSNCESLTERKCKSRSKKMYKLTARDHLVGYCRFCFSRPAIKQWQQQHKTRILTTWRGNLI